MNGRAFIQPALCRTRFAPCGCSSALRCAIHWHYHLIRFLRPVRSLAVPWPLASQVVYKGWTKRSCPFHTSYKSINSEDMNGSAGASSKDGSVKGGAEGQADGAAAAGWAHAAADVDDDAFVLPGFNSPPLPSMTAAAQAEVDRAADAAAAGVEEAKDEVAKAAEAAAST